MKTKLNRFAGLAAKTCAYLGVLLLAGGALADTTNTYSGYECMSAQPSGNQGGFTEGATFSSGFTFCPMDRINSPSTTAISSILVRVNDTSSSSAVTCHAVSCAGLGDLCSATSSVSSSGTGAQFLNLGNVSAQNGGYAYVFCTLPNTTSTIISYRSTD